MLQLCKAWGLLYFGWLQCHRERVGSHLRIPWGVLVKLPKLHAFVPRQWLHAGRLGSYVCRVAVPAAASFPAANLSAPTRLSILRATATPQPSALDTGDQSDHANVLPVWFDVR